MEPSVWSWVPLELRSPCTNANACTRARHTRAPVKQATSKDHKHLHRCTNTWRKMQLWVETDGRDLFSFQTNAGKWWCYFMRTALLGGNGAPALRGEKFYKVSMKYWISSPGHAAWTHKSGPVYNGTSDTSNLLHCVVGFCVTCKFSPSFFIMERAMLLHKQTWGQRGCFKAEERGPCAPTNSQVPVCSWTSLLSTCVNAMLDKFLFEFPCENLWDVQRGVAALFEACAPAAYVLIFTKNKKVEGGGETTEIGGKLACSVLQRKEL